MSFYTTALSTKDNFSCKASGLLAFIYHQEHSILFSKSTEFHLSSLSDVLSGKTLVLLYCLTSGVLISELKSSSTYCLGDSG